MSDLIATLCILCILYGKAPILVPPTPIGHTESRLLLPFRQCSAHSHIQYRALPILTCQTESNLLPPVRQSPAHSYLSDSIPHLLSPFLTVLPTPTCNTEPCPNLPVREHPASLTCLSILPTLTF